MHCSLFVATLYSLVPSRAINGIWNFASSLPYFLFCGLRLWGWFCLKKEDPNGLGLKVVYCLCENRNKVRYIILGKNNKVRYNIILGENNFRR